MKPRDLDEELRNADGTSDVELEVHFLSLSRTEMESTMLSDKAIVELFQSKNQQLESDIKWLKLEKGTVEQTITDLETRESNVKDDIATIESQIKSFEVVVQLKIEAVRDMILKSRKRDDALDYGNVAKKAREVIEEDVEDLYWKYSIEHNGTLMEKLMHIQKNSSIDRTELRLPIKWLKNIVYHQILTANLRNYYGHSVPESLIAPTVEFLVEHIGLTDIMADDLLEELTTAAKNKRRDNKRPSFVVPWSSKRRIRTARK